MAVKYLINWTQEKDGPGGTERRYSLMKMAFPEAELISAFDLSSGAAPLDVQRLAVDKFLRQHTSRHDVVIKDAGVGGITSAPAKTVLIFGSPYLSLIRMSAREDHGQWIRLVKAQRQDLKWSSLNIANSRFSKRDAKGLGCKAITVIENGVDTDFWKPLKQNSEPEYILWVGSAFKERHSVVKLDELTLQLPLIKVYKEANHSKQEMLQFYQHAACLIQPFPIEGNCNTVLEALACDVPIITTRSGRFWDNPIDGVGELIGSQISEVSKAISQMIGQLGRYNPRDYIFANKLTAQDFIANMREAIGCLG